MTDKDHDIPEIEPWEMKNPPSQPSESAANDFNLKSVIRNSFREPILHEDSIYAEIENQRYQVANIGSQGLGIIVPDQNNLKTAITSELTLHIGENSLVFTVKITHISPCDESGQCHCGIKIMDMSEELELKLQQFLVEQHAKLFPEENK